MRTLSLCAACFLMSGAAMAQTAPPAAPGTDANAALAALPGRDVMIQVCSKCHSPLVVTKQQLDAAGWKDMVNQMANNGAKATDAQFDEIANYLAAAFPASR
jgi:hypothetical protein